MLTRLLEKRGITVAFITDGAETCEAWTSQMAVPAGSTVIFVIVPSQGDINKTGPEAVRRASSWRERVPGLKVVLPHEVTNTVWQELAHEKEFGERVR